VSFDNHESSAIASHFAIIWCH